MGILNVTPDSFSDGGSYVDGFGQPDQSRILTRVEKMIKEGADIIDIGGESTRPGAIKVTAEEEIAHVIPVIRSIKERFDVEISVDTYKAKTAREAVFAGASIVNDIGMMKLDPDMARTVAELDVRYVLTHNIPLPIKDKDRINVNGKELDKILSEKNDKEPDISGNENGSCEHINGSHDKDYIINSYVNKFIKETLSSINEAVSAGIEKDKLIIDPGIGFNKTYEQNLYIMRSLDKFCSLGYPVLLGTSRKSFIGMATGADVSDRLSGTLSTTVMGVMAGVKYFRVHDVADNVKAIKMTEAILNAGI
ncbi:MAG: dihydropteroate synthase [Lachnospiraceae bacterium]|nr:dihydropteroate synthase [Lachnospiraceae bacterium]